MEAIVASLGDAVVSALFRSLVDLTSSAHFIKFAGRKKILSELKKWETMLLNINASIEDAEEKQTTSQSVKLWLTVLRDIAYDAEDIIDELATEAQHRQMKEDPDPSSAAREVRRYISTCCLSFNPSTVKFSTKMESKIKKLTARLEEAVAMKDDLSLVENDRGRYERMRERLRTSSLVDDSRVYGREGDKEAILDLLMKDSDDGVGVVSIVGMGGVGKTTLAQLVYNDAKVERFFDLRVWVCVSEEFDVVRVTTTVLQAVTLESCNLNDLNLLQVSLKEKLFGKKFFIVLDDVWNENYEQWEILCRPFIAGAAGSKILVTTRNEGVASIMATCGTYHLKELTDDDCLSLFTRHALGTLDFEGHPNLKKIGEEIVRKCKGLPLAAKTLGGLLRTKGNRDEWEDILKSKMWDFPEERSGILPALRLSYHHLPFHLKRCFSYCAIFPKDYEFDKDELVLLWMAEGFLHQTKEKKQMKDIGVEYFHDLRSRSFFQQSTSNKSHYVMHDLINDLAQFVSRETCFNFDGEKLYSRVEKFRHLSFLRHQYDISKRFEILYQMKCLRTFLALPIHTLPWATNSYISNNVLQELLPRLTYLRVLCLSGYCIVELPHHIGSLIHLRYLNLSHTRIKSLPDSVGSLFNLQTLILHGCKNLIKLPQAIENLINLHVLDLTDTDNFTEMPMHIGNLKNLQILSKFIVQRDRRPGIGELKGLLHLRKELSILGLENVVDARDAMDYILKDKQGLDGLDLQWSHEFLDHGNGEDGMPVFNMLQPHENLKKLRIVFYGGRKFPSWLGGSSWANIVDISLSNCRNVMFLPELGRLPSLKKLSIDGMNGVKELAFGFFGDSLPFSKPFPVLEVLQFQNMLNWKYWYYPNKANKEDGEFPSLRELMIHNCPKLYQKLPRYLPSLVKLIIKGCPKMANSVMSLPSLLELNIEDCSKMVPRSMVDLTSLTTLRIRSLSDLTCLPDGFQQFPGALKHLVLFNCTGLTSLWQKGTEFENIVSIQHAEINGCSQSFSLGGNEKGLVPNGLYCLMSLEHLHIESCPKFVSFLETGFFATLRHLQLRDCPVLKNLPSWIMRHSEFTSCLLEDLEIEECPSLKCFPRGSLPPSLKRLKIQGCIGLHSLPEGLMQADNNKSASYLENLEIIGCPSLVYFPEGKLPTSLKMLKIWDCLKLEPLSDRMLPNNASLECIGIWNCATLISLPKSLQNLTCLVELNISNCQDLKYFPEIGLPLPNLRTLDICTCVYLNSLPDQMLNLTSLQYLTICDCPCLVSFPRGGLPPNLLSLEIWDCKELKEPVSKWNLHTLTSLRDFSIAGGPEMVSFPDERCLLPTTLVSVYIARLHNLESLSSGLQNLSLLEELEIVECPKLRCLPRKGLPATLGRLCIRNCSLLENQCSREKGEYWPLIAGIPCVEIEPADI
ncbi:putative disease resistance RPP13-like protein 1 [Durio zibethinus]|uniref:Disease resistance RPP13-like protein 1 n=1 Tax=Durio zibethinus TaxID=66656 RepID=A0A6P5ZWP2_DURZI|nr:putative disease resistance RPP13-like protein 1 [Durio zibethinus]